jgi:uncharacterized protein YqhQ
MKAMWTQTVYGTAAAAVIFCGLIVYFLTRSAPDYEAARFLVLLLVLLPVALAVAYGIRRLIESLAD